MLLSPYRLKANFDFRPSIIQQGISAGRLAKLVKTGQIGERSEAIIHFLYELKYLSGHLILTCFNHPRVDPGLKKLRNDKKNPYRSEITFLLNMGIIRQYQIVSPYDNSVSYVYELTDGASTWSAERFHKDEMFISVTPHEQTVQSPPSYEKILSLLSLNQFIISFFINNWNSITDVRMDFAGPIFTSTIRNGKILSAGSIRRFFLADSELIKYMNHFCEGSTGRPDIIILVVESMEAAADLHRILQGCKWPGYDCVLYARDYCSMNLKNPLNGALGRFTDHSAQAYDLCTLDL